MPVFHLDIEAFMTTVARTDDGALAGRPLIIAPVRARSVVLAASPEAKKLGVQKDMALESVRKHFPDIRVIPPNYGLYERANRGILGIVQQYSPIVEPLRYGHIAMDMTGMRTLHGSLENAALKLNREIMARLSLPATIGIAANKLVSTIAAKEIQKEREPLYEVAQGNEPRFLAPLSCKALPEWSNREARRLLFELNLRRIGQIQIIPRDIISYAAGAIGGELHRHAMGIDPSPVTPPRQTPQLSAEHRFTPDTNDDDVIRSAIYALIEKLCYRLRERDLASGQAHLSLRYTDDVTRKRHYGFVRTRQEAPIYETILKSYARLCDRRQRVRYLSLSLGGLCNDHHQPGLFDSPRTSRVAPHLDAIRRRFGADAVGYGKTLKAGKPVAEDADKPTRAPKRDRPKVA